MSLLRNRAPECVTGQPVEHMPAKRMSVGHVRMVEVVGGVVGHAEPFHDAARRMIVRHRERHDFVEPQRFEPERERGDRAFSRVAVAPVVGGQPPAEAVLPVLMQSALEIVSCEITERRLYIKIGRASCRERVSVVV